MAASEAVRESFDAMAADYESAMDRELQSFLGCTYTQFVTRIIQRLAPQAGERILDVATGTAQIPLSLARALEARCHIVGLDITPAMLIRGQARVQAQAQGTAIHLVCGSGTALPLASASFDAVICGMGMHHMQPGVMAAEMRRVLRPGGRLIMVDAGASRLWRSALGRGLIRLLLWRYGLGAKGARIQAELEALQNMLPAQDWEMLLSHQGYHCIEIDETRARRPWYPNVLEISAMAI